MHCDCHIHMVLDGDDWSAAIAAHRASPNLELIRSRLESYAAAGISYLRDGGDAWGVSLAAREMARDYGIDYASPAFPIYRKGRYGAFIGLGYSSESEYLALLDRAEHDGADFIKLMLSGIMDFDSYGELSCEPLPPDEMEALVRAAHARGFAVMAHVNGDGAVRAALDAGVDSIEHGNFMSADTVRRLADSDCVWTPTFSPVLNAIGAGRFSDDVLRRIGAQLMENTALAASQGAYIALGSDCGAWRVEHPTGAADELRHMSAALGSGAELVLGLGSARIKEKFRRRS